MNIQAPVLRRMLVFILCRRYARLGYVWMGVSLRIWMLRLRRGLMPTLKRMREDGTDRLAHSVIPSFTNPNNLSIATGRPPIVHGICGNYLIDPETGEEVMMNDVRFLRAPTVFSQFYDAGARVAVVTAKDKLRALLGAGLKFDEDRANGFSSEKSARLDQGRAWHRQSLCLAGHGVPEVYSAELSEFVFAAGVKLLREWKPDVMYLSTTDYIQHKYAPDEKGALDFYAMFDQIPGRARCAWRGHRGDRRSRHEAQAPCRRRPT